MKSKKTKAKRATAKKPAARAAAKSRHSAPLKAKLHRKQSAPKPVPTAVAAPERERTPSISLFWPTLPFAMMQAWWGTGEAVRSR
jgi:hypothetical protein